MRVGARVGGWLLEQPFRERPRLLEAAEADQRDEAVERSGGQVVAALRQRLVCQRERGRQIARVCGAQLLPIQEATLVLGGAELGRGRV